VALDVLREADDLVRVLADLDDRALERVRHLLDALVALQVRLQGLRVLKGRGASAGEQRTP